MTKPTAAEEPEADLIAVKKSTLHYATRPQPFAEKTNQEEGERGTASPSEFVRVRAGIRVLRLGHGRRGWRGRRQGQASRLGPRDGRRRKRRQEE